MVSRINPFQSTNNPYGTMGITPVKSKFVTGQISQVETEQASLKIAEKYATVPAFGAITRPEPIVPKEAVVKVGEKYGIQPTDQSFAGRIIAKKQSEPMQVNQPLGEEAAISIAPKINEGPYAKSHKAGINTYLLA